jgi:hypothetical protein
MQPTSADKAACVAPEQIEWSDMKAFIPTFSERRETATTAKNAALARFRARPASNDPAVVEQRAARQAAAATREVRAAERLEVRRADDVGQAAELAAGEARQSREADEQVVLEARRKAARDMRYAARKVRKA